MEKKLDGNSTRMLRAILNKSSRQHPIKQQLYSHIPPITKTMKVTRTRHAGQIGTYFSGPLHIDEQRQDDQLEPIYNSSVPVQDVALKTDQKRWTIEKGGGRGLRISVLVVRHDDEDVVYSC